jgi:hypothetical protein
MRQTTRSMTPLTRVSVFCCVAVECARASAPRRLAFEHRLLPVLFGAHRSCQIARYRTGCDRSVITTVVLKLLKGNLNYFMHILVIYSLVTFYCEKLSFAHRHPAAVVALPNHHLLMKM